MKKSIATFSIIFLVISIISCSKNNNDVDVDFDETNFTGVWQLDSSIYIGYAKDKKVVYEVDKKDIYESQTMHFNPNGTFDVYESNNVEGYWDTTSHETGNYIISNADKKLTFLNDTYTQESIVTKLTTAKLNFTQVQNNYPDPEHPEISKQEFYFFFTKQ